MINITIFIWGMVAGVGLLAIITMIKNHKAKKAIERERKNGNISTNL